MNHNINIWYTDYLMCGPSKGSLDLRRGHNPHVDKCYPGTFGNCCQRSLCSQGRPQAPDVPLLQVLGLQRRTTMLAFAFFYSRALMQIPYCSSYHWSVRVVCGQNFKGYYNFNLLFFEIVFHSWLSCISFSACWCVLISVGEALGNWPPGSAQDVRVPSGSPLSGLFII